MIWQCENCGNIGDLPIDGAVTCRCGHVDLRFDAEKKVLIDGKPIPPNVLKQGYNYVRAWTNWVLGGRPKRSDEEVQSLRKICAACSYFDGHICTHEKCGCSVDSGSILGDKLRWETEHCPINKW